jgi:hypothetical protein
MTIKRESPHSKRSCASRASAIDELEGKRSLVLVPRNELAIATTPSAKLFGGPRTLRLFRKFDKPLGREHFEPLVVRCRDLAGAMGRSELLTRNSGDAGTRPNQTVTVVVRDGATTLQVTDQLGALAGAIYGGGGGVGGGGLAVPIVLSAAATAVSAVVSAVGASRCPSFCRLPHRRWRR